MIKELRKIVTFDEDIYKEGGKEANPILRVIGVAAVLENPWKGEKYVDDLQPEIRRIAPVMGKALTDRLLSLVGSGEKIEAYGKAALAGSSCEIEHASAIIHTLQFFLGRSSSFSHLPYQSIRVLPQAYVSVLSAK